MRAPLRIAAGMLAAVLWASCGGGGSSGGSGGTGGTGGTGGSGGNSSNPNGSVVTPTVVSVAAGQTTAGVDINVPGTASTINAEVLGVADPSSSGGTAFNTGAAVARGTTMRVLMFGKGLSGNDQITISGPGDITISNPQSIKATDNTPGVVFTIVVSPTAAVGARTVILRDASDNVTTFTGGLEVQ